MQERSLFFKHVGDSPRMRVLQHFIEGRNFEFMLTDLINAGVSWGTLNQLVPQLMKCGIITKTRKIGRATLYKLNKENIAAKQLTDLYDGLILERLNQIEEKTRKRAEIPA